MTSSTRISVFIGPRSRMIINTAPVTAPTVRSEIAQPDGVAIVPDATEAAYAPFDDSCALLAYVALKSVLEAQDQAARDRWFRGRIVLVGEVQPYSDRVPVPVNLAGWETGTRESPAIVVHAQALRTALARSAPADASRAVILLLITAAAFLVLVKDWRIAAAWGVLGTVMVFAGVFFALRGGLFIGPSAVVFAVWAAVLFRGVGAWRARRNVHPAPSNFPHPT